MALQRIGKYEIVAELGQGGFGTVYRAYDTAMRRQVAVKILASAREPEMLARFRSEAGTTGSLSHKNIVTVYDYGELDGSPYLVMELLEGKNLKQLIEDHQPLSLYEKIQIIKQVAEGLLYAHRHGVIHRDVKPANVMALPDGSVKIMDFGIARMTTQSGPRHTMQGMLVGTMQYMSPDQFKGHDADVLTDVFAFGVLCYEFLAGRHPFQSEHLTNTIYLITECNPPMLRTVAPDIPESVEALVHRALAKNREIRYPSLDDVLFDTESILLDFRQEQAAQMMAEAEALVAKGRTEEALKRLRDLLELDSAHREAHALRRRLQSAVQRENVQNQVRGLMSEGEAHLQERRYSEAARAFSSVTQLDPQHSQARILLEETGRRQEAQQQAARLLSNAKQAAQRSQWTEAWEQARRALSADSSSEEARTLLAQYAAELEQEKERERKSRTAQLHAQILQWIGDEKFEEAERALNSLTPPDAASIDAPALREKLTRQRDVAQRKKRTQALRDRTANALAAEQAGRFDEAIPLWESLARDYPDDTEAQYSLQKAQERLEQRRRAEALGKLRREAQTHIDNQRYPEAIARLRTGLERHGADEVLERLLQTALVRQEQLRLEKLRIDALEKARAMQAAGDSERALNALTEALRQDPNDPALLAALQEARKQADQRKFRDELGQVLEEGKRLLALGQALAAVGYLERFRDRFGAERDFTALLSTASTARAVKEQDDFVSEALAWSNEKRDAGQFEAALEILRPALGRYPQNGILADASRDLHERIEAEQRATHIDSLSKSFQAALAARDWNAADKTVREFQQRYPQDKRLPDWQREVEQGKRSDQTATLSAKVRECWQKGDLAKADSLLNESRNALSFEIEYQNLQREQKQRKDERKLEEQTQKKEQQARQERTERLRRMRADAEQKRRKGQLAAALLVLDELCRDYPEESDVTALRDSVKQEEERKQEEQKRAARMAQGRTQTEQSIKAGRPAEAVAALEKLLAEFPGQGLEKDLASAKRAVEEKRKADEASKVAKQAEGLLKQGKLALALEVLLAGVREHPANAALANLLASAQADAAKQEQRVQKVAETKNQVEKLRADGKLNEAAEELDKTLRTYADEPDVQRMRQEVAAETAEREKRRVAAIAELRKLGQKLQGKVPFEQLDRATYRVSEISSPFLGDGEVQREADAVRRKIDDLLRGDEQAAPKRELTETVVVKTAPPVEPVVVPEPRVTERTPEPEIPPSPARKYGIWAAAAAGILGIGYWALTRSPGGSQAIEVHAVPAEARVEMGGQTCAAQPCRFKLPAGAYDLRVSLDGYAPAVQHLTVDPKQKTPPMEVALQPLPSLFQISTNWSNGSVRLDGKNAGRLRDGQLTIPNLATGPHDIEVSGEDGRATLKVEAAPAHAPVIRDLQAGNIRATAIASMGRQARIFTGGSGEPVSIDGNGKGAAAKDGLALTDLSDGAHKLQIGDGEQKREIVLTVQPEPEAQLFLSSDRDVGAVLIEANEENAVILVDRKRLDRLTTKAPLQLLLDTKPHLIEIQKNGFQPLPAQRVSAKRNGVERLSFRLSPLPSRLLISDAMSDTHVSVDGREIGVAQGNGAFTMTPGKHTIQLSKPGYAPVTFLETFEPGASVQLAKSQVRLTQIPKTTEGNTGQTTVDPKVQEARDWEQVQNSRNVAALEDYRRNHPGGAYSQQAAQRIDQLEWDAVKGSSDANALRSFANAHSASQYAAAALRQADQIEWSAVNRQDAASLKAYLQKYPNGAFAQQAQTELNRLELSDRQRLEAERQRLEAEKAKTDGDSTRKADARQVLQALGRLSAAYGAKDDKAILRAWPSLPPKQLSRIKESFKATTSISLTLTPTSEVEINNDTATVACRRELRQVFKQEVPPVTDSVVVHLRRGPEGWAIESIT